MKRLSSLLVVVFLAVALTGCAATLAERQAGVGAGIGSIIGGAAGAGVGYVLGGPQGAAKGALIGGLAGAAGGAHYGYSRGAALEQQQAATAAAAAAAAPQEACQWYYDHNGRYQWSCQGSERRYRATGTPIQPLPPPEKQIPMGAPAVSAPPAVQPAMLSPYIAPRRSLAGSGGDGMYGPTGRPCQLTRLNTWRC